MRRLVNARTRTYDKKRHLRVASPRQNYFANQASDDEFLNSSLLDPMKGENGSKNVIDAIDQTVGEAEDDGL